MTSTDLSDLARFAQTLDRPDVIAWLRDGVIGEGREIDGPFGKTPLVYADYVASGRALRQVEEFVLENILPWYANSHTEASFCGATMTRMRHEARATIARLAGATEDHAVIFAGSGATTGLNRLVHLFGLPEAVQAGARPVVIIGPYEHHSNILPWRESGAEVIEIGEGPDGGPDLDQLDRALAATADRALRIGAFSAASNVTGIVTDPDPITRRLRAQGVLSVWDYAGAGPYLPIDMCAGTDCAKDAVVVSPHKFLGGPGATGLLILRKDAVQRLTPVHPGGGTVRFVSPAAHDYIADLSAREEAGTPNVIGDIRAALAFMVKDAMGQAFMDQRHEDLNRKARAVWEQNPNLEILGTDRGRQLPIFSFRVRDPASGGHVHHQLFTRMLSDLHGIQARGGCACAGPYAHRLLEIDVDMSETLRQAVLSGVETDKPGWVRLNFSVLTSDAKADFIIDAVDALARDPKPYTDRYEADIKTARFKPRKLEAAG